MGCLIIFVATVVIGGVISESAKPNGPAAPPDPLAAYRDSVGLEMVEWHGGGFDNVMIATFRVLNNGARDIRDVKIRCNLSAESGTEVGRTETTVLRIFPAGLRTPVMDLNMGFMNTQATTAKCSIQSFALAS